MNALFVQDPHGDETLAALAGAITANAVAVQDEYGVVIDGNRRMIVDNSEPNFRKGSKAHSPAFIIP